MDGRVVEVAWATPVPLISNFSKFKLNFCFLYLIQRRILMSKVETTVYFENYRK